MNDMLDRLVDAIARDSRGVDPTQLSDGARAVWRRDVRAVIEAMREPSEAQWDGLARQIIMWMDMEPKTPRALFRHLEHSGHAIPQWLRDEPEMKALDHVPSKGTRAVIVYRAMLTAALGEGA